MQRRLAAIFAADVVGYSRLMGADEAGTLKRLKALRRELVQPRIMERKGRIVKLMGDGLLAEFPSVVEAVQCAFDIQQSMTGREADMPDERRIQLRIGINLGDIIVEGSDIYGDGVNVAARLEALAEPGGICISASAFDAVYGKLDIPFEDIGAQQVKNIAKPVRAYRLMANGGRRLSPLGLSEPLQLPDKPSIAVLPFDNMSNVPDQDFLADGLSEDIITALSKFHSLFVIARNSSFSFKGQHLEVKEIGKRLGVRYVVEGSVRRIGDRARITAQLIDAVEDKHIWAERYDRDLEDIFVVQDEVTRAIVLAIEPELASSERLRARRKPTDSLGAWECYQRGLWHLHQYQVEDAEEAISFLQRAIEIDPTFASAHAGLAFVLYYKVILGFSEDPQGDLARALAAGKTAVRLDENDPFAHVALGRIHTAKGEHEEAIQCCDRAIALNPSYASAHFGRAHSLWMSGQPDEAVLSHDEAMRLSPRDPLMWAFQASKAIALILLGRYEDALEMARQAQRHSNTALWAYMPEVSALGTMGRLEEARAALVRVHRLKPDVTCNFATQVLPFTRTTDREHFVRGLLAAGVPE